jgi:hypothetical protein
MKHVLYIFGSLLMLFVIFVFPRGAFAATCNAGLSGGYSTSTDGSCSFSGTVNGADTVLTVSTGTTLTIQPNQAIGATTIVIQTGGSIILPTNGSGSMKPGTKIWYVDTDGDHNPSSATPILSAGSPGAGYVQKNTLMSTNADCYESGTNSEKAYWGQTTYQATARGDGSWDYDCTGTIKYQYETCVCDICANGCPASPICGLYTTTTGYTPANCGQTQSSPSVGPSSCTRVNDGYGACTACNNGASGSYVMLCL